MAFPHTDYPGAYDAPQVRVDGADTVFANDPNYQDEQVQALMHMVGLDGGMVGADVVGGGSEGMVSAQPSGGPGLRLATRDPYVAGDILQVGDNFDAAFVPKFAVDHDGLAWALGGFDASAALYVPTGVLGPAGDVGRVAWDPGLSQLVFDDGAAWVPVISAGGSAGSYLDWANDYSYTEAMVPVEEVIGGGVFDGSLAVGAVVVYLRCAIDPSLTFGSVTISLYDMGPKAGPLGVPRLVATLPTGTNGLQSIEQALVVDPAPGPNEISDTARIYEMTITSAAQAGDTAIVYSAGLEVR